MIEMDEEEYLQSAVSDEFLYMVLMLLGPEVKDKFLYTAVEDVRLHSFAIRDAI